MEIGKLDQFRTILVDKLPETAEAVASFSCHGDIDALLDSVASFARSGQLSERANVLRMRLITLLQNLLVNIELLGAYARMLVDRGVAIPSIHTIPARQLAACWDSALANKFDEIPIGRLFEIASDPELLLNLNLSLHSCILAEDSPVLADAWQPVFIRLADGPEPSDISLHPLTDQQKGIARRHEQPARSLLPGVTGMRKGHRVDFSDGSTALVMLTDEASDAVRMTISDIATPGGFDAVAVALATDECLLIAPIELGYARLNIDRELVERAALPWFLHLEKRISGGNRRDLGEQTVLGYIGSESLRSVSKAAGNVSGDADLHGDTNKPSGGGPVTIRVSGRSIVLLFKPVEAMAGWLRAAWPSDIPVEPTGTRARLTGPAKHRSLELECALLEGFVYLRAPDERQRDVTIELPLCLLMA